MALHINKFTCKYIPICVKTAILLSVAYLKCFLPEKKIDPFEICVYDREREGAMERVYKKANGI